MARLACAYLILCGFFLAQAVAVSGSRSQISKSFPRKLRVLIGASALYADQKVAEVEGGGSIADPPAESFSSGEQGAGQEAEMGGGKEPTSAEAPELEKREEHHRSSSRDKSVAGGGVIIGGLVTAIFAAVYCYIRVTRRRDGVKN